MLTRVYELQKELLLFFQKEKHGRFCKYLRCEFWMAKMEYLTEMFGQLNIVNSMQDQNENILILTDKLVALKKKLLFGETEQNWVSLICFLQCVNDPYRG